jgi:hypothetical protein
MAPHPLPMLLCAVSLCATAASAQPLPAPTPQQRTLAVVLLSFADLPWTPSTELVRSEYFGAQASVRDLMADQTYGLVTLTGQRRPDGDIFGPFRMSLTNVANDCEQRYQSIEDQGRALAKAAGVDLSLYNQVVFQMPRDRCIWTFIADDKRVLCWGDTCPGGGPRPQSFRMVTHSLLLQVSQSGIFTRRCRDTANRPVIWSDRCTDVGFVDPFDLGDATTTGMSSSGSTRWRMGVLTPSQLAEPSRSGTVTLSPVEVKSDAPKLLKIFAGYMDKSPSFYLLDFRQPAARWSLPLGSNAYRGVSLRRARLFGDPSSYLLDANPATETFEDAPLLPGARFSDPAIGLTVEVVRAASTGAEVRVTLPEVATPEPAGQGTGLKGEYFAGRDFKELKLTRVDRQLQIKLDAAGVPAPGVPADFGVRWTGELLPRVSGRHSIHTLSDDGVRVSIGGQSVIDNFSLHAATSDLGTIELVAGQRTRIQVEFFDALAGARLELGWSATGLPYEAIPASQLFPPVESPSDAGTAPTPGVPGDGGALPGVGQPSDGGSPSVETPPVERPRPDGRAPSPCEAGAACEGAAADPASSVGCSGAGVDPLGRTGWMALLALIVLIRIGARRVRRVVNG